MNVSATRILFLAAFLTMAIAPSAGAVDAPYEKKMMRLGEVLGSLHYLRNLCGEVGNQWREQMETMIAVESPPPEKRARYVASFNRGYRSFAGTHISCTSSTVEAISRYMKEGETLSRDLAVMYGN